MNFCFIIARGSAAAEGPREAAGQPIYCCDRSAFVLCFIQLEKLLGFHVTSSPIDDCSTSGLDAECSSDEGCSSSALITGEARLINTNETSLVGLAAYIRSECACAARTFSDVTFESRCRADSCLNGGTCYELEYSVTLVN